MKPTIHGDRNLSIISTSPMKLGFNSSTETKSVFIFFTATSVPLHLPCVTVPNVPSPIGALLNSISSPSIFVDNCVSARISK